MKGLLSLVFLLAIPAYAQVQIKKYAPGAFMSDNEHRIELVNTGIKQADLSDHILITRDYFVRIPKGTTLNPGQNLTIMKVKDGVSRNILELKATQGFVTRQYSLKVGGNFVVLYEPSMRVLDAFYYSQLKNPPFLPDFVFHTFSNNEFVKISVPAAGSKVWDWYPIGDDPAIAFEQSKGEWKLISARKYLSNPSLQFGDISARYNDGLILLYWSTISEENSKNFEVERSLDRKTFVPIGKVEAKGNSRDFIQYRFSDPGVQENKIYYYRLKHTDPNGVTQYSRVEEVKAQSIRNEFTAEIIQPQGENLTIRFYSAYSQRIHMRILNESMQVSLNLFDNFVYADAQNLIKLNKSLRPGKYLLVTTTETRRFWQEMNIE
jgi:hypothetical protein